MRTKAQILQERTKFLGQAQEVRQQIEATEGDVPAELIQQFEGHMARVSQLDAEARRAEQFDQLDELRSQGGDVERRRSDPLPHQDPANQRHRFSLTKAIREVAEGRLSGLELETTQAISERSGQKTRGFYLPWDLSLDGRAGSVGHAERRDLEATTNGPGAVGTVTSGQMIDFLSNTAMVRRLGATIMPNMQGNFRIPKQTAIAAATWKGAGAALDEQNPTIGAISFSPNRLGSYIDYDKDLVFQSSIAIDQLVFQDLVRAVALKLDQTAINGTGTGAEPEGLLPNSSLNVVALGTNGAAPTWAAVVALEGAVETDNALMGNLNYLTTPAAKSTLKTTTRDGGSGLFLWDDLTNTMNGYAAFATNQVPANLEKGTGENLSALIFGDWSSVHIAFWGGMEVLVNPYTQDINDLVRVSIRQQADVQFRHIESFSAIKDMITS